MPRAARIWRVLALIYWCGLFALTHIPAPRLPVPPLKDKTIHFLAYGGLGGALYLWLYLSRSRRGTDVAVLVLGILLAYGAIDEWTQIPVHRSCEMADWYADAAGAAVAVVVMTIITAMRRPRNI